MGYLYENSNPERFQHLCQSLLISSFPKLQCFPIGQPDGGRDGWDPETKTVLQVKFKRADDEDNADWLIGALEKELPKVRRLAERGATNYIMATNARGTAHEDVGRIDKVQHWIDENFPIPGTCFWRDEIDRRLDDASTSLKLKYSELLSLEDGIEVVLGKVLGANKERQQDAIRAFIASQFESDKTVKFKQVSLSNDLLDLFIDVPVGFPRKLIERSNKGPSGDDIRALFAALTESDRQLYIDGEAGSGAVFIGSGNGLHQGTNLGTAELLLGNAAQTHLKLVVLEGAPGQGKSTLAQYVCQLHRARYLKKTDVLERVSDVYRQTAFRIPLKVDLRDYAAFLSGKSPFKSAPAPSEPRTLDVFLAQLIGYNSGGIAFDAHDVLSLLKHAPTLLFLDGLDEVADIVAREALVTSIGESLSRWSEFDADLQVVVTSRPSVFGRAPSFGRFGFSTLTLQNIDSHRINDYADRWVVARGLDASEKKDVKKILSEKLELAHIRDLTRNPMQLTILLSLIHQFGHSLPDQRTDLYDRYVDLFLTREADKSVRVRENRAVLLGFIQHLAWVLQSQAEASKSAGSISEDGLQEMAREYLRAGGHPIAIADELFGGGLERIFVLVERIEGLYEFEVQPLREFYCAQYLYSTAQVGTYRDKILRGDRAQRFEALAANPLWLNVCRFYAGSCERGETGTLVFSLEEMIKTGDLAVANHARRVGLALLQDWVFSNVKYSQDQLIKSIFDENGTQILLTSEGRVVDELVLDIECGRNTLRDCIFTQLKSWPVDTRTAALCSVIRANGGDELSGEFCDLLNGESGSQRTYQLIRMFRAGASAPLAPDTIWELITEDGPDRAQLLLRISELITSEPRLALRIPGVVKEFVRGVLNGLIESVGRRYSPLSVFADVLGNTPNVHMRLRRLVRPGFLNMESLGDSKQDILPSDVKAFLSGVVMRLDNSDNMFDQRESQEILSSITEISREHFGETWAAVSLAIRGAGIKTAVKLPEGSDKLFDSSIPICVRARAARLRRGGTRWWVEQLNDASTSLDRRFWVGMVLMWSSLKNLHELSSQTNEIVGSLSDDEYDALRLTLTSAASFGELRADRRKLTEVDIRMFSARAAVLVAIALRAESSQLSLAAGQERVEPLRTFLESQRDFEKIKELPAWKDPDHALAWARQVTQVRRDWRGLSYHVHNHLMESRLQMGGAEEVLKRPSLYPPELVSRAVMQAQRRYRPRTLAIVSKEQDWAFD
ncbi:NACHT domain-containing protein [Arthrobacter cheniae]|uniref:NACHT domain-containing protein n=1 Tax=Arthrobacter cheniae TaxID=1258888 RepID=UPI0011C35C7B|nr:hypothetical protein [Arthrobacter cheniae]